MAPGAPISSARPTPGCTKPSARAATASAWSPRLRSRAPRTERPTFLFLVLLLLCLWPAAAGSAPAGEASEEPQAFPALRVAFLGFEYDEQADSRIGQRIAELLSEALALNPALKVLGA